jgi:ferrous iron transport protein A
MDKIKVGQRYQIKRLAKVCDRNYRYKLLSMGLTPGAIFSITRVAPLGDPVELRVNDFSLSLRLKELLQFELEAVCA